MLGYFLNGLQQSFLVVFCLTLLSFGIFNFKVKLISFMIYNCSETFKKNINALPEHIKLYLDRKCYKPKFIFTLNMFSSASTI